VHREGEVVGKRAYYFSFKASPAAVYSLFGSSPSSESCIQISANHCTNACVYCWNTNMERKWHRKSNDTGKYLHEKIYKDQLNCKDICYPCERYKKHGLSSKQKSFYIQKENPNVDL
jgi:hypothetical protein